MRKEVVFKTKSLVGVSDLTIAARIKPGLVPSLEAMTYKTRARAVLKVLNGGRTSTQEYALLRPFSDSVERVRGIHSVRIAVIDDKVMLAATFDGNFESYIRVLWQKVGTLLDLVFCNTVDHVGSLNGSYAAWRDWVYSVQVETDMFYSTPGLTYDDVQFLRTAERRLRNGSANDAAAAAQQVVAPEVLAWQAVKAPPDLPRAQSSQTPAGTLEAVKQGLQSLSVLYRLADFHVRGTPEGDLDADYLQRAAQDLLLELRELDTPRLITLADPMTAPVRVRFAKQLAWFEQRILPAAPPSPPAPVQPDGVDVQGGIVGGYPADITHGCLLLIRIDDAASGAALLGDLHGRVWRHGDQPVPGDPPDIGKVLLNIAFTCEGLRAFGLSDTELETSFPQEFREGMEARCSVLGDLRLNHPRRWRLPERNWPASPAPRQRIELSAVHLVVQLRVDAGPGATEFEDVANPAHPLHAKVNEIFRTGGVDRPGVQLLSVQPMRRAFDRGAAPREHFGFVDGQGNPQIWPPAPKADHYDNNLPLGEILLGHANQVDPAPKSPDGWLFNGSFLVVRKLRQDVARLNEVVAAAEVPGVLSAQQIKAKMMGRTLDGVALVAQAGSTGNDFNYQADPAGERCPFQSHVRRANPRQPPEFHEQEPGRRRPPRIMRRGMSYGPRFEADPQAERGMVFMAYNASIAEQFEVVQRWLVGGNSSGISSAQTDPFLGVGEAGDTRTFRFNDNGQVRRVALEDPAAAADESKARPLVRLEWGMYLFTPSLLVLECLRQRAAKKTLPRPVWSAETGERLIAALKQQALAQPADAVAIWKAALEDPEERRLFNSASIWAAIRKSHGGVLATPYGVLVADHDLAMQVFSDTAEQYSMAKHLADRMAPSIGEIYLGLDRGAAYNKAATAVNKAIQSLRMQEAFELARDRAAKALLRFIAGTHGQAKHYGLPRWELNLDLKEISDAALAAVCEEWLGLPGPGGGQFQPGGFRWDWAPPQKPFYPGHFTAPSRFIFQAQPGDDVDRIGKQHGVALREAALAFVQAHRDAGTLPGKPLADTIFNTFPTRAEDDMVARTLIGTLMGMLPTVEGNLRSILNEWLLDGSFWRLRATIGTAGPATFTDADAALRKPLAQAMQLRPMPELVWRTAAKAHTLGPVAVSKDDRIVVAIVSATQQHLAAGLDGVYPVFGGERTGAAGSPTHACPGYHAGMGLLLGLLTALLQAPGDMRPSPAPLSVTFTGVV